MTYHKQSHYYRFMIGHSLGHYCRFMIGHSLGHYCRCMTGHSLGHYCRCMTGHSLGHYCRCMTGHSLARMGGQSAVPRDPDECDCNHVVGVPANTMWRKLLYSGFHTAKAVTYHEPTVIWLFMIGHSLGRMETCFGPRHLRCRDPISKHISNPDFAPF